MDTMWQQSARKRWPRADVRGNGPFAVYCACPANGLVMLFELAPEAMAQQQGKCLHAFCKFEHVAYKLKPMQQPVFQQAHALGWE